jgi:hypothetical protein
MFKKVYVGLIMALGLSVFAQQTADFENLQLPPNTFWNGQNQPLGSTFSSGAAEFYNYYDTAWGGFWSQGWAYSTVQDTTTTGFTNLYATAAFNGHNGSSTYAVGQQNSVVKLTGNAAGKLVRGAYFTNTTYAWLSMRDGDAFAKQFGGATGNDPDFFVLSIKKWYQGQLSADSVLFYLADYRFADNAQDYIVTDWKWVDLSVLGNTDSLVFELFSSDMGQFGMNTPAFFCMDDLITENSGLHLVAISNNDIKVFPNPASDYVMVTGLQEDMATYELTDLAGSTIFNGQTIAIAGELQIIFNQIPTGIYTLQIQQGATRFFHKISIR